MPRRKLVVDVVIKLQTGTTDFNPRLEGQGRSRFNESLEPEQRDGAGTGEEGLQEELGPQGKAGQPELESQGPSRYSYSEVPPKPLEETIAWILCSRSLCCPISAFHRLNPMGDEQVA